MSRRTWGERISVDPQEFGQILRSVRSEQGLSQENLAMAMTMIERQKVPKGQTSANWVRLAERGALKSVDTQRIMYAAEALGVPVSRLLPPPKDETAANGSAASLIVAFRRYGLAEADIAKLLPLIQQFTAGNQEVRLLVEKIKMPKTENYTEDDPDDPETS